MRTFENRKFGKLLHTSAQLEIICIYFHLIWKSKKRPMITFFGSLGAIQITLYNLYCIVLYLIFGITVILEIFRCNSGFRFASWLVLLVRSENMALNVRDCESSVANRPLKGVILSKIPRAVSG